MEDVDGQARLRKPHDGQSEQRSRAHGVDVAERVGRRDLPEDERIIHDRREEIDRLDQRGAAVKQVDSGVVGCLVANQDILTPIGPYSLKRFRQRLRRQL